MQCIIIEKAQNVPRMVTNGKKLPHPTIHRPKLLQELNWHSFYGSHSQRSNNTIIHVDARFSIVFSVHATTVTKVTAQVKAFYRKNTSAVRIFKISNRIE